MCQRLAIACFLGLLGVPAVLARALVLESFEAEIRVESSGDLEVEETIRARFEGQWNGLYRFIPVEYRKLGMNDRIWLDVRSVTDDSGRSLRYEDSRERHYRMFKIWVPGAVDTTKTVVLRYRVRNALRYFDEYDELYWNVTGDEGVTPIESASARIQLPPEAENVRAVGFTGPFGSQEQAVEVTGGVNSVAVKATRPLAMREGLTVAVAWGKGLVQQPSLLQRSWWFLIANWFFLIPALSAIVLYRVWLKRGRDPAAQPVMVMYQPPEGLSPAEAGTLVDHKPNLEDITASLVDLAIRGFLEIEEDSEDKDNYIFHMKKGTDEWALLKDHERELLDGLFLGGVRGAVTTDELEQKFYKYLERMRGQIFDSLVQQGFYARRPDKVRGCMLVIGFLILWLGLMVGSKWMDLPPLTVGLALGLTALVFFLFAWIMPARTIKGARMREKILGFQDFLEHVEEDRYRQMITGPEMFEEYLPYAMALRVDKRWAAAFEDIYIRPPGWYRSSHYDSFHSSRFNNGLRRMSSSTGTVLASSPRSSGGSGFSGGSSGGGSGGGGTGGF